jgi:hypothetical protein
MKTIALGYAARRAPSARLAQEKTCSPAEATRAEQVVDRVVNWELLYKAWQDYRHCDKGAVDENFTEALLRLIVDWKQVPTFAKHVEGNKDYREFVHKHISSPAAKGDVDAIVSRTKNNCPKGLEGFCKDLASGAKPLTAMETLPTAPMPAFAPEPSAAPPKK